MYNSVRLLPLVISWSMAAPATERGSRLIGEGGCHHDNCSILQPTKDPTQTLKPPNQRHEIFASGGKSGDYINLETGMTGRPPRGHDPYEKGEGKMWLVPPFLIGACSVILLYIVLHCIYLHCYARRKMRQHHGMQPALVFSDQPSTSSIPFTPIVKYDGSFSQTELYLCRNSCDHSRRKSSRLQLPFMQQRLSSASSPVLGSTTDATPEDGGASQPRASICFVPVSRKASGRGSQEWLPLQGFVCSGSVLSLQPSTSAPCPHCSASSSSIKEQANMETKADPKD